jgi:hypothetical protein
VTCIGLRLALPLVGIEILSRAEALVDFGDQGLGIEGGADFDVVVEIDEDVAGLTGSLLVAGAAAFGWASGGPGGDAVGPEVQGFIAVAAGVEFFGAVEAAVDEVCGDIEEERPGDGVGDDEADVVLAEKLDEGWGGEAFVADFDGVAEWGFGCRGGFGGGSTEQPRAVQAGERGCGGVGAREEAEEGLKALAAEAHLRGELPEEGTELGAEFEQAAGEEVGERLLDVAKLVHVGDEAGAFDGEDEVVRRGLRPGAEAGGALQRIEGAVNLDRGEGCGGEF